MVKSHQLLIWLWPVCSGLRVVNERLIVVVVLNIDIDLALLV